MNKTILGAAALAALAAFPAAAQQPAAPMHHREARAITRAEFQQRLHAHFAKLDVNSDGFVDRNEAGAGMAAMHRGAEGAAADGSRPHRMHRDPGAMFDAMDANHDGALSRAEFLAAHASGRHHGMGAMARADDTAGVPAGPDGAARPMRMHHAGMGFGFGGRWFDRLDADHDGRVSLAEADRGAAAMFDRLDANHDGTISPDERAAARQAMRQRMDERPAQ